MQNYQEIDWRTGKKRKRRASKIWRKEDTRIKRALNKRIGRKKRERKDEKTARRKRREAASINKNARKQIKWAWKLWRKRKKGYLLQTTHITLSQRLQIKLWKMRSTRRFMLLMCALQLYNLQNLLYSWIIWWKIPTNYSLEVGKERFKWRWG